MRDPQQEPLIGVNVHVKGTTIGTVTDINGNYFLEVPDQNAVLEFSYIGFQTHEVRVGSQININVNMEEESSNLEEVVVVGYGSQKKVNLTGSVGQIDSKVLESRPITSTTSALQGTIPNLQITNTSGEPGQGASGVLH